jgi:acetylornithine deacetylase/succinyl-diaminopimelate desuccinylase-like protein
MTSPTPAQFAAQNSDQYLAQLIDFLRIPSVSTQPAHDADTRKGAEWLADSMVAAGLNSVQIIKTARHPLVYADWLHAGPDAPTVLIYGHYDVQPAEPFDLWQTPPFEPTVRDGYLYARGASDDKGQVFIHVKAVEAYLKTVGRLPINVKFIVEGEEEMGGASLAAFIPEQTDLLAADVALVSDTAMISPSQPVIVYGLRGLCYVLIDVTGPGRDLHSGSYGGGIDNPLNVLGHFISKLKDENGRILIPGFYDKVRPISEKERELLSQLPLDQAVWLKETGAPAAWGESDYTLVERLGARPTLDVHGIIGGYTGPGAKTVLPSTVHAKISMRLVPDQDPQEIGRLFKEYVEQITPDTVRVDVQVEHGGHPTIVDIEHPAIKAAVSAYQATFDQTPVFMREGGSIPVVNQLRQHLGLETVLMGFGLPDDKIHAPNERFYLDNFYRGIQTSIRFLALYGQ